MKESLTTLPAERIEQAILVIRGERVILDSDLAKLYGVTTARLNQQVRRNTERFPDDFMFELTKEEYDSLMLQIATSNPAEGPAQNLRSQICDHMKNAA
jgi:hypothetical protein